MTELNIRDLSGEIMAELEMAAQFGVPPGFEDIDTKAIREMIDRNYLITWVIGRFTGMILARHCGETLVNCDEQPIEPLPKKEFPETV